MKRLDHVRDFQRAAKKRRQAAGVLIEHSSPMYTDAMYLAGYAGECTLKALILKCSPVRERESLIHERFRGARAHDISNLRRLLEEVGVSLSRDVLGDLSHLGTWSTDWRYRSSEMPAVVAKQFVEAVDRVIAWVDDKLS